MTGFLCNYAIIRFLPYKEIGEFVNVGVLVHCPETGFFDFKLAESRYRRIHVFFPELDRPVFRRAMEALGRELTRRRNDEGLFAQQFHSQAEVFRGLHAFKQLLGRREAIMQFSSPGSLVADPLAAIEELFGRYVKRDFALAPEYQEKVMRRRLGDLLTEWGLRQKYQQDRFIGDELFRFRLPFVYHREGEIIKALKPLDLNRDEPTKVFEHGDIWVQKMRRLQNRGHLPKQMVFAINLPELDEPRKAADIVCSDLQANAVQVVNINETDKLRLLAQV